MEDILISNRIVSGWLIFITMSPVQKNRYFTLFKKIALTKQKMVTSYNNKRIKKFLNLNKKLKERNNRQEKNYKKLLKCIIFFQTSQKLAQANFPDKSRNVIIECLLC